MKLVLGILAAPPEVMAQQFLAQIKKEIGIWRKVAADADVKAE